jgi:hypothetical protein
MTKMPVDGYQVKFNGTDYHVEKYTGEVITYCQRREDADEYCRLLNATRIRRQAKPSEERGT